MGYGCPGLCNGVDHAEAVIMRVSVVYAGMEAACETWNG